MPRPPFSFLPAALVLALLGSATAHAVDVPVTNPSFELPAIAAGTFSTTSAPPGWTEFGSIDFGSRTIGVLDPATTTLYTGPVPDGENVGVVFLLDDAGNQTFFAGVESGMFQTLSTPLENDTHYTLTVEVGNIGDDPNPPHGQFQFADFPGYRVELMAGSGMLASDDALLPPERGFSTSTVEYTSGNNDALAGQSLGIRLVNRNAAPGLEVNFDDVRLDATPVPAIPAMGAWGLGMLAAGGVLCAARALARRGPEQR